MLLFDAPASSSSSSDPLVIRPPAPDAHLSRRDEFTYSNLYGYDCDEGGGDGAAAAEDWGLDPSRSPWGRAPSLGAASESSSQSSAAASVPLATSSSGGSSSTSSSLSTTSSFGANAFDAVPRNEASAKQSRRSSTTAVGDDVPLSSRPGPHSRSSSAPTSTTVITRDPRNGAFTFAVHAEYDLLLHVQRDLDAYRRAINKHGGDDDGFPDLALSEAILRSVDEYCLRKQWMYHVGREKGLAVARFLTEGVEDFVARNRAQQGGAKKTFTCVELGTYCGYSALVLASALRRFVRDQQRRRGTDDEEEPFEFRIYTTEVSSKLLNVAQSVFRLAKVEEHITPVLIKDDGKDEGSNGDNNNSTGGSNLPASLRSHGVTTIDFLLLDHAKSRYLRDLLSLEQSGMIRAGTRVSADNVVFNRLDAYRDHVRRLAEGGYAISRLEEMNLEYSNNLKDGMEMTVYLKDPPGM